MDDLKILLYLVYVLIVSLLPVYLYRRNWKETGVIAGVLIYFFVLNYRFIWGQIVVFHDTLFTYEFFMRIFKQWLDKGISIGWNPYMGGGEPLYLYSNYFLWAQWIPFCWINEWVQLPSQTLFNLFWLFLFINFSVGSLLLFLALYRDFKAALFSFAVLLMSGMFISNLGQPTGLTTMYYFPYVLFGFIMFWERKRIYGIGLAILFLGIASNHYIPHYIFLCISIFVFFVLIFDSGSLFSRLRLLKSQYKVILVSFVFFLLAISPVLDSYLEIRNCVSPSRGGGESGTISLGRMGFQANVNAPLRGYKVLLEQETNYLGNIHHAFYFGIVPLFLIILALFRWRNNKYVLPLFASITVILFLSTGSDFWGYRLLIKYVPTFNLMRHSFGFAQFVSLLFICLAGYGFRELSMSEMDFRKFKNIKLAGLFFLAFVGMLFVSQKWNFVLFGSLFVLFILTLGISRQKIPLLYAKNKKWFVLFLILFTFVDLTFFYQKHRERRIIDISLDSFKPKVESELPGIVYPTDRSFYPFAFYPIPPDISPLIFKKASLTHKRDDYVLLRNVRIHEMLKFFKKGYEQVLGVDGPIIYFTPHAKVLPKTFSKEKFIKTAYEDILSRPDKKTVFFSEKDVDFYGTNNNDDVDKPFIEFPKEREDSNVLELVVKAPRDGFLVRLENFHSNWRAFIDGEETRIYRANYAFQAIRVPKGKHEVSFRFSTIYPLLLYIHIFCVFLTWVGFNFYLFNISKKDY